MSRLAPVAAVWSTAFGAACVTVGSEYAAPAPVPTQPIAHAPLSDDAPFVSVAPVLDGRFDADPAWDSVPWSTEFVDIEGPDRTAPRFSTRMKMCWDQSFLFVLADMQEPDLWATLTRHDEIVFHDHDIEVFIDPDGDTREYYEIEVNALGTVFDLFLHTPYRAGGPADHGWNAAGMRLGIDLRGTLNDPRDRDNGWSIELAIPWECLQPMGAPGTGAKHQAVALPPNPGDAWRINFSRVEWTLEVREGTYAKVPGRPEDNWTWTPQWEINMHVPQHWGTVRFTKEQP
ncbi:MAG: hypothetical protein FJ254_02100 [Phycisphaerae bacterium]|nr:hypothetical protein [Phycisphaerae bacterium]